MFACENEKEIILEFASCVLDTGYGLITMCILLADSSSLFYKYTMRVSDECSIVLAPLSSVNELWS